MAREILKAKDQIHKLAGELAGGAASVVGVRGAALEFTKELAVNIALPIDAKMIAVARGVQVAGVLLCVMDNRDLTKCECFIDLAKAETKERVNGCSSPRWPTGPASLASALRPAGQPDRPFARYRSIQLGRRGGPDSHEQLTIINAGSDGRTGKADGGRDRRGDRAAACA
jgi:hypothetical protein